MSATTAVLLLVPPHAHPSRPPRQICAGAGDAGEGSTALTRPDPAPADVAGAPSERTTPATGIYKV